MTRDLPNTPSPHDLWERDRAHSLQPGTNGGPFEKEGSLVIARGEGCYLWDVEGRRYLDAVGGMWCTNVGLGRRDASQRQQPSPRAMTRLPSFSNDPKFVHGCRACARSISHRSAGEGLFDRSRVIWLSGH